MFSHRLRFVSVSVLWFFLASLAGVLPQVRAQSQFPDCASRTGTNATLLLPSDLRISIEGRHPEDSLQIAVFNSAGKCTGVATWDGSSTAITVWGQSDTLPPSHTAERTLSPGDSMTVRVFDPASRTVYQPSNAQTSLSLRTNETHLSGTFVYSPGGIYVVDEIRIQSDLVSRKEK